MLGDVIEAVYIVEASQGSKPTEEGSAIIDKAIETFDTLISRVNDRDVKNRPAHLNEVRTSLESEARELVEQINKMA